MRFFGCFALLGPGMIRALLLALAVHLVLVLLLFFQLLLHRLFLLLLKLDRRGVFLVLGMCGVSAHRRAQGEASEAQGKNGGKSFHRIRARTAFLDDSTLICPSGSGSLWHLFARAQTGQKRLARALQPLVQPCRAIAPVTCPGLASILVAALAPIMRILHPRELEVLVPVGPLFEKRRRAVTHLHPAGSLIREEPRILHVAQILAFGYRALTESFLLDGLEQVGLAAWLDTAPHQVAH